MWEATGWERGGVVHAHGDDVTGPAPRHKFNREVRQLSQATVTPAVSSLYRMLDMYFELQK